MAKNLTKIADSHTDRIKKIYLHSRKESFLNVRDQSMLLQSKTSKNNTNITLKHLKHLKNQVKVTSLIEAVRQEMRNLCRRTMMKYP